MIGLDTNVVVRFLTSDHQIQSNAVKKRLAELGQMGQKAYLSKIVLLETVWVLSSAYELTDGDILEAVTKFCQLGMVQAEDPELLSRMNALYAKKGPGLADQMILADCVFSGCECVITFDKKAKKLEGFVDV